MKNRKAFTLVELIVVIVIIAALVAIGVMSYIGAQAGSRDAKRKSDVNTFMTAMTMYKVDKKTFSFPASTNAGNSTGEGFINKTYDISPKVSIVKYLTDTGYLTGKLEDPKYDETQCTGTPDPYTTCQDYAYFYDSTLGGGAIYAKLEKPKYGGDNDRTNAANASSSCTGCADFATVMADYQFAKIVK